MCCEVGFITCTVIITEEEPTHKGLPKSKWKLYFKYVNMEVMLKHLKTKYMHANTPNMNKYDYNHTQNQMVCTKSKAVQHVKIEDIALSNTIAFESNTLKYYFFDRTTIIPIQFAYWTKKL